MIARRNAHTDMKSISVVIPNYNGAHLLPDTIRAARVALATSGVDDAEVIVADDASGDDSLAVLRRDFSDVRIVANPENGGFGSNCNTGLAVASKELVFFLNSDVHLGPGYFADQLPLFKKENTFACGGALYATDTGQQQGGAKVPDYSYANLGSNKNFVHDSEPVHLTFHISGANLLADREKLVGLGGFCELFSPYYYEDVELSLRAWRSGYKLYFVQTSVAHHALSSTIADEPSDKVKRVGKRNKFLLHELHLDGAELRVYRAKLAAKAVARRALGDVAYWRSYRDYVGLLPAADLQRHRHRDSYVRGVRSVAREVSDSMAGRALRRW